MGIFKTLPSENPKPVLSIFSYDKRYISLIFSPFLSFSSSRSSNSNYSLGKMEMKEEKKVQYEKFAALLALEACDGVINTKAEFESRVNLLSPPITGRQFHFSNIKEQVEKLITTKQEGREKTFRITTEGKDVIYEGRNNQILLKLLGRAIRSVGEQFSSYGQISEELEVRDVPKKVKPKEFSKKLDTAISKASRMSGWAKIEDVQKRVCADLNISKVEFSKMCRKIASDGKYNLAPGRKGEKITVDGRPYGLIKRGVK